MIENAPLLAFVSVVYVAVLSWMWRRMKRAERETLVRRIGR